MANSNIFKEETVSDYQTINNKVSMTQLNVKNKVNDDGKSANDGWSKNKDENQGESEGKNDNGKEIKVDFSRETETEEIKPFEEGDIKEASTTKDHVKSEKILNPEPYIDQIDGNDGCSGSGSWSGIIAASLNCIQNNATVNIMNRWRRLVLLLVLC